MLTNLSRLGLEVAAPGMYQRPTVTVYPFVLTVQPRNERVQIDSSGMFGTTPIQHAESPRYLPLSYNFMYPCLRN